MASSIHLLVFILIALSHRVIGAPSSTEGNDRIFGGTVVTSAEAYPFFVSVKINDAHICGGMLYSYSWVLTSATCVFQALPNQVTISVGSVNLINPSSTIQNANVFKIFINDNYDDVTRANDLALLQLARSLDSTTAVKFIRYDEVFDDTPNADIMGFGTTSDGGLVSSRLRSGTVTITGADCTTTYTPPQFNKTYHICAGTSADTVSPCSLDEGSPLVQTQPDAKYAVGILTRLKGCTSAGSPSVYTRLSTYYAWLTKIAGFQP